MSLKSHDNVIIVCSLDLAGGSKRCNNAHKIFQFLSLNLVSASH